MQLTLNDLKDSTRKLCFLSQDEYERYDPLIIEAANYALLDMAKDFPLYDIFTITKQSEDENGYETYDLLSLSMENMRFVYSGTSEDNPVVRINPDGLIEIPDFTLLCDRFLLIPRRDSGTYKITYKRLPERIDTSCSDDFVIPFSPDKANLLPLLMAWRVIKDDDERKASMYYNEYINSKQTLSKTRNLVYPLLVSGGEEI